MTNRDDQIRKTLSTECTCPEGSIGHRTECPRAAAIAATSHLQVRTPEQVAALFGKR